MYAHADKFVRFETLQPVHEWMKKARGKFYNSRGGETSDEFYLGPIGEWWSSARARQKWLFISRAYNLAQIINLQCFD